MSDLSPLSNLPVEPGGLLTELRSLIQEARQRVAQAINGALALTYWRIGKRLLAENLTDGRGEYGRQILVTLSQQLVSEFGQGFSYSSLTRMVRFAELFPDEPIVASLTQQLTWTQPAHTGQMELYLRWLDKNERLAGEQAPIGLILCAGADAEQVELLQLDEKSIRVAEYLTELPPLEVLRERLHRAIAAAREQTALPAPEAGEP